MTYTDAEVELAALQIKAIVADVPGHVSDRLADHLARAALDAVAGSIATRALRYVVAVHRDHPLCLQLHDARL
jgi:hypothetical protein